MTSDVDEDWHFLAPPIPSSLRFRVARVLISTPATTARRRNRPPNDRGARRSSGSQERENEMIGSAGCRSLVRHFVPHDASPTRRKQRGIGLYSSHSRAAPAGRSPASSDVADAISGMPRAWAAPSRVEASRADSTRYDAITMLARVRNLAERVTPLIFRLMPGSDAGAAMISRGRGESERQMLLGRPSTSSPTAR